MQKKDYYNILNVDKKCSDEEIRKSYKKLALQYHPDKNHGDDSACEKFKEISEAYSVLGNKDKRSQYDLLGCVDDNIEGEDPFSVFNSIFKEHINSFMNMKYENDINIGNIFNSVPGMGNSFGNVHIRVHTFPTDLNHTPLFEDMFSSQIDNININNNNNNNIRKVKIIHQKPDDIIYNVNVNFADIYNLSKKTITISRSRKINGKYVQKKKKIQIPIYGKEVFLEKEGNELKNYKERGNVIINIFNEPSSLFKRINDYDILTFKEIELNQIYAPFIYQLELPNKKSINIKSEAMVSNGYFLQKVINKGLPYEDENNKILYGNLYIKYKILFPSTINDLKNIIEPNNIIDNKISDINIASNCLFDEIFKNE